MKFSAAKAMVFAFSFFMAAVVVTAVEGTYVPENNFTVTIGARVKLPQAFGVTFPDVHTEFKQANVPANNAIDAINTVVSALGNLGYTIDSDTGTATPNGIEIIVDSASAVRQAGPVGELP